MKVVVLRGDGIGPEITTQALRALTALAPDVEIEEHLFGARAIRATRTPLPDETLAACLAADAVLKGPIGAPEYDAADVRPEQGLLRLRAELGVYANLRPARADGIDLLIVRESSAASTTGREASATTAPCSTRASTRRRRWNGSPAAASSSRERAAAG